MAKTLQCSRIYGKGIQELKKLNRLSIFWPLAIKKEFDCVLLTEYVHGKSLYDNMKADRHLYTGQLPLLISCEGYTTRRDRNTEKSRSSHISTRYWISSSCIHRKERMFNELWETGGTKETGIASKVV